MSNMIIAVKTISLTDVGFSINIAAADNLRACFLGTAVFSNELEVARWRRTDFDYIEVLRHLIVTSCSNEVLISASPERAERLFTSVTDDGMIPVLVLVDWEVVTSSLDLSRVGFFLDCLMAWRITTGGAKMSSLSEYSTLHRQAAALYDEEFRQPRFSFEASMRKLDELCYAILLREEEDRRKSETTLCGEISLGSHLEEK